MDDDDDERRVDEIDLDLHELTVYWLGYRRALLDLLAALTTPADPDL